MKCDVIGLNVDPMGTVIITLRVPREQGDLMRRAMEGANEPPGGLKAWLGLDFAPYHQAEAMARREAEQLDPGPQVRHVRVLEYVGPATKVQHTLERSIQGRLDVPGGMTITAVQLDPVGPLSVDAVLAEARQHPDVRRAPRAELQGAPYHARPRPQLVDRSHWPDCAMNHGGTACDMGPDCGSAASTPPDTDTPDTVRCPFDHQGRQPQCCVTSADGKHEGPHLFKCAGPNCPGLIWPASVQSHPVTCRGDG